LNNASASKEVAQIFDLMTSGPKFPPAVRYPGCFLLAGMLAFGAALTHGSQLEVKSEVSNRLTYRSSGVPGGTPTGNPTITPQFANVVESSAGSGPISNSAILSQRYASSGAVLLQRAAMGNTFVSGVPRYFVGDRIEPPTSYVNVSGTTVATAVGFWRAEPIRPGEIVVNPDGTALLDASGQSVPNQGGVVVAPLPDGTYQPYYYSPHAREVFAHQSGQVQLWWRSSVPGADNKYVLLQETFSVSSATARPIRSIYWTEKSFNGPLVSIPSGRIVAVNPVYSNVFPRSVASEYQPPGSSPPADPGAQSAQELRTLWFDKTSGIGTLRAYNVSGRIFVEYLGKLREDGTHEFLGADVVEVSQEAPFSTITTYLGEEIRPAIEDRKLIALPIDPDNSAGTASYYSGVARPDGSLAYYAERENGIEDRVVFFWLERLDAAIAPSSGKDSGLEIDWPKYLHKYLQVWPEGAGHYAHYTVYSGGSTLADGTGLRFEGGNIPNLVYQDDAAQVEAMLDGLSQRLLVYPGLDGLNRSLLKFTGDNGGVWYVRLYTQSVDRTGFVEGDGGGTLQGTVFVGQRIERPSADYSLAGFVASGTAYSPHAYRNPFATGIKLAEGGAIIPVNALPGEGNPLTVWWFKRIAAPSAEFSDFYTPAKIGRYTVTFRSADPTIVLASNQGSGDLPTDAANGTIYTQNDSTKPGFNPNEEHALMHAGRAYALRDDLNVTSGSGFTSLPRVLVQYTSSADNRPAMRAFQVAREDATHKFNYAVTAGTIVQAPMPLPVLPLPIDPATGKSKNVEVVPLPGSSPETLASQAPALYKAFTFQDRKGYDWVYRGPHAGGTPSMGMQFYYTMRSGFFVPNVAQQPAVGTPLPYLRPISGGQYVGDSVTAAPLTIVYRPEWPSDAPTMSVGETLTLPNHGLPAVRGQSSAVVLYQQSVAKDPTKPATILHDPTRAKTVMLNASGVGLNTLPSSISTTSSRGKTYFQLLPPHLQERIYFDPNLGEVGGVTLIGAFVDEIAGEDYVHLNVLSLDDIKALKALADPNDQPDAGRWANAIDALATKVETFIEDPFRRGSYIPDATRTVTVGNATLAAIDNSDTAVDSYALTATGAADGFVTLLFGNGEAFTAKGEPVALQIVRVVPQLYTGDLKKLPASNPLDEQTTLRHSGDFAAKPENYDFEWRYAAPVDGVAPATYQFEMKTVVGGVGTDFWQLAINPATPLPASADYAITPVEFGRSLAVNSSSYSPSSKLPGTVAKSTTGVTVASVLPSKVIFSADLGAYDGFVLYVNGAPALASRLPVGVQAPGNLSLSDASTSLSRQGLTFQYTVSPQFFVVGANRVEVALYSSADPGATSRVDLRMEVSEELDQVDPALNPGSPWILPNGKLSNIVVVGGSADSPLGNPLLLFSDNYFTMRYRARPDSGNVAGDTWSRWMEPKLVESWIKRALDGINPFNQRTTDLFNNPVSTDVSILTQAGTRWEGDVSLNIDNIEDFGLIEIYETLLNRAKKLSIDAGYDDPGINDTLLLSAGYLADLYMVLGNEASDDADNPTIAIDADADVGEIDTSRFSFEGQVASLIDEELTLLAGRDDFLSPRVTTAPIYNRLYWNFINGINSGESIYVVNYNIKEKSGDRTANGVLDAADAQRMFPQGHGDAYGHYLTAVGGYYKLLTSPSFTWVPRSEGVDVLGQTVQVDYQDERKFASAAAGVARTGLRILDITSRRLHREDPREGWSHLRDGKVNSRTGVTRHRGADEWASRGGLGAYLNWVSANAMLPDVDDDPSHSGIQVIDRSTVPELSELVSSAIGIQAKMDALCAHLNPLGLAKGAIPFDISPTELKAGVSHFEQIYARALRASLNASAAFQQASRMNRLLRTQSNTLDDYNYAVAGQERAYEYELITLFGSAYPGDVGPGKLYAQGYAGPDLYRYWLIDRPSGITDTSREVTVSFREPVNLDPFKEWSLDNVYQKLTDPVQFTTRTMKIAPDRLMQFAPSGYGRRREPGAIQAGLLDAYQAQVQAREMANQFDNLMRRFERDYQLFAEFRSAYETANEQADAKMEKAAANLKAAVALGASISLMEASAEFAVNLSEATAEGFPGTVGLSFDATSAARAFSIYGGAVAAYAQRVGTVALETKAALLELDADQLAGEAEDFLAAYQWEFQDKQHVVEFERLLQTVLASGYQLSIRMAELQRANEKVASLIARADRILADREVFRQRAAAVIQGYRTRDMTYRTFRNEELSQYQSLYDLAAQYTYLAAQSYDYETGLLGTPAGEALIDGIVGTRSLGRFQGANPVASTGTRGDGGLASLLARLQSDWSVVKPRLGINNPDQNGTLFSLRHELFRIRSDAASVEDDKLWRQVLEQHIMSNLLNDPDVALHCRSLAKPDGSQVRGIVIPFYTTIGHGLNFFGRPLSAGDHAYSPSNFATKIYSTGVVLKGYIGMDPYAFGMPNAGGPASSDPLALSATPYVYLIPAGEDRMFAPPLGNASTVRSWSVKDQAIPLPFNLGLNDFSATQFFTPSGSVNEELWILRQHQAFRPVNDPAFLYSSLPSEFTSGRLVGRSVWNTRWKLVIPAYSLLNDEQGALDRFVRSVNDVQVFFRTYSTSGN
jgi:hypothetical protein